MYTVIKIVTSALIIGLVTELARRFPLYGGIIAALPLISLLSIIWLKVQGQSPDQLQQFLLGVILGLPSTMILLIAIYFSLKNNIHISLAFGLGFMAWFIFLSLQNYVTLFMKQRGII